MVIVNDSDGKTKENNTTIPTLLILFDWAVLTYYYYLTGPQVVHAWSKEKQYYDYATNTCAKGQICGHYTQVE